MRQAIHIFRKDIRYLWLEICLFIALAALFGWRDYEWSEILLPVTAVFFIVRLIQAETIPGDTQFWITRPYRWRSLLAAKLLFMLTFISAPVLVARIIIIERSGFPLAFEIVPLLWSQFLMIVGFCLPVAALAAVTADMVTFVFSTLTLLIIGFFGPAEIPSIGILHRGTDTAVWPEGVEWIRLGFFLSIVILTSGVVLFIQYRARQTKLSRLLGLALLLFGILSSLSIPPTFATELHAWFSGLPAFASQVRIEVGAMPRRFAASRRDLVQLSIPLDVTGIPADVDAHLDAASITLEAADGQKAAAFTIPSRNVTGSGFDDILFVDPTFFFASERKQPLKLRGTAYITVFGNRRSTNVTFTHEPQNLGDGLRCYVNDVSGQLHCRSALRWPRLLVDARVRDETEHFWSLISYSPFPSGMELNYVEEHRVSGPPPHNPQATILTMEPLAHFRTDFSVDDFPMERFALSR